MPFFGKKESKKQPEKNGEPSYPRASYPVQPAAGSTFVVQPGAVASQPAPPPPYAAVDPNGQYKQTPYNQVGGASQPAAYYQQQQPQQQQQPYMVVQQPVMAAATVPGQYDAGARFGVGSNINIPPPAPGFLPNHAQMAHASGQPAVVTQQRETFWNGTGDGGMTIW